MEPRRGRLSVRTLPCILPSIHLAYCPLFILQTMHSLFNIAPWDMDSLLMNQRWTWRAPLQLGLTLMGSLLTRWVRVLLSFISFFYIFPKVVLLALCLAIVHMKFLGWGTSYCKSCIRSSCPYYFWDHPGFKGCWFKGPLLGGKGMLLVVKWGCATRFDGPSIVHACPTLHY